ncbi:uncharacterized protein LOC105202905 [Solenopsis invicta]|uniref:uncharacterized protein LOC105202905 n=1 Tax=Solenopsis invicta TaxID=13686 RepID=UPI00059624B9|nr:uncharacterized protein LOC105202905 [Solenopsis invicta]
MSKTKKRKHSRSRSRERSRNDDRKRNATEEKLEKLREKVDNLTTVITTLIQAREKHKASDRSSPETSEVIINNTDLSRTDEVELTTDADTVPNSLAEKENISEEMSKMLGEDQDAKKLIEVKFHSELQLRWQKWMRDGLPEGNKKAILEMYPRKGDLFSEAPKINLEILPALTEIATKRDQHFAETQNCVGSAIAALAAAVSMLLEGPEEGIDQEKFTKYLCDVGQLLTEVYHQQSLSRKAFITPLMNKAVKPTLEAAKSDQWLYGEKFGEQVKEAKSLEKACANIKAPEKTSNLRQSLRPWNQGNARFPPVKYRQVGYQRYQQRPYQRRNTIRFKPKDQKATHSSKKSSSQTTTSRSSSKK